MMIKMTTFSILGRTIAPALLLFLPAAAVCAQNAPAGGAPAAPAKTQPAQPAAAPTTTAPAQAVPAKTPAADTGTTPAGPATATTAPNRAQAYYHLALAGVYEDDAISDGRTDEVNKAIEEYKLALNADPNSAELADNLADLYFRVGRVHDAEVTARTLLKSSPDNIDAHKLLGRIYLRQLGEG
jgi:tetratricopeptide (TPR) repeat protein